MAHPSALVMATLFVSACGGSDFSTKETKDGTGGHRSGGSASGGVEANQGGMTATALPAVDCASLWQTYLIALDAARACDTATGDEACKADWILPGPCGCSTLVNAESVAYSEAKSKYDTFVATECVAEACAAPDCPVRSGADATPTCSSSGSGNLSTCQW
jgi:hypothetical protein